MYDLHVAEGCVQRKKHHEGTCMILAYHQTRMGVSGSGSLSHPHLWPTATFVIRVPASALTLGSLRTGIFCSAHASQNGDMTFCGF